FRTKHGISYIKRIPSLGDIARLQVESITKYHIRADLLRLQKRGRGCVGIQSLQSGHTAISIFPKERKALILEQKVSIDLPIIRILFALIGIEKLKNPVTFSCLVARSFIHATRHTGDDLRSNLMG